MRSLYHYRDLIVYLVARDLKVRYRRSALGIVWTMLQPLLTMGVLYVVFSSFFHSSFDLYGYQVYVLAGLMFWNFFQQSILASMNSLRGNAAILRKLPVPIAVFPVATVISGLVNLVLALVPLMLIMLLSGHPIRPAMLFLPLSMLIAALFTLGAGLLLSPLSVFFADVTELVGVGLTLVMYLTPIFYPLALVPQNARWAVYYNPVRSILEIFRDPIYFGKIPPFQHVLLALSVALVALVVGWAVFRRSADRIPLYV